MSAVDTLRATFRRRSATEQPGAAMTFTDHLRELRRRSVRAVIAMALGTVVAWLAYEPIFTWLVAPYSDVKPVLAAQGIDTSLVFTGIGGAFQFQLKVSLVAGFVLASPWWIWQVWAYVVPALHHGEKRAALKLSVICAPLFLGGAWFGYLLLPRAIEFLVGFVPQNAESLLTGADYLDFSLRIMLVFAVAAQLPVVIVMLHQLGLITAPQLVHARPWIITGIFAFSGIATPTVDPVTMAMLAMPMVVLYGVAEVIVRVRERRGAVATDATL
ncbi:twin-arginine translocase subunit TatC [Aeromicrobium duanguangcaii]|uniref:Sec-independent protein translocase protein TatC n=1 Tax=Aeromicrobium duanguangcaii TaxID=2968086 RepID=A0ABY5KEP8_9ACTN|nr:twin-arginine translocase subunit TatC [Aeromicrobium duanguangcaii]MCD9155373.1 twin-arginine translocase subunit TatC [Aeromicrobium duanguangcaii]MCL3838341.1 twin-arginine translocase subunit TatC [Aeromicrobium duanguangcaii]UUI68355.1 twin-arginine translocase subunit TatC [Aeromicrobium duanguangcaii]